MVTEKSAEVGRAENAIRAALSDTDEYAPIDLRERVLITLTEGETEDDIRDALWRLIKDGHVEITVTRQYRLVRPVTPAREEGLKAKTKVKF